MNSLFLHQHLDPAAAFFQSGERLAKNGETGFALAPRRGNPHIASVQMQVDYPDSLPDLLQTTRSQFEAEARMAMAVKLYELKRLSSGLAARLAGVTRVEFLLGLHRYGVPVIDLDDAELRADLQHA